MAIKSFDRLLNWFAYFIPGSHENLNFLFDENDAAAFLRSRYNSRFGSMTQFDKHETIFFAPESFIGAENRQECGFEPHFATLT